MKNSRTILLTGGTGFVGQNLAKTLANESYEIIALTRTQPQALNLPVQWVKTASLSSTSIASVLEKYNVQAVVHAAGKINGSPSQLKESNEQFTESIVEAISTFNRNTPFIFISSVSAGGKLGAYGESKFQSEEQIKNSGLESWTIFRPSLLYGPGDNKNVATLIKWVKTSPLIPVLGSREVKLQPLYVGDFSAAVSRCLFSERVKKRIYTVAGPKQEKLWDMLTSIQSQLNKSNLLFPIPLKPIQATAKILAKILPSGNLPFQQIATLHDHPAWSFKEAAEDLHFKPMTFSEGLNTYH